MSRDVGGRGRGGGDVVGGGDGDGVVVALGVLEDELSGAEADVGVFVADLGFGDAGDVAGGVEGFDGRALGDGDGDGGSGVVGAGGELSKDRER